jgi:hypothetical protein
MGGSDSEILLTPAKERFNLIATPGLNLIAHVSGVFWCSEKSLKALILVGQTYTIL